MHVAFEQLRSNIDFCLAVAHDLASRVRGQSRDSDAWRAAVTREAGGRSSESATREDFCSGLLHGTCLIRRLERAP